MMTAELEELAAHLTLKAPDAVAGQRIAHGELTLYVAPSDLVGW
jgi:hypothetical protein